MLNKLLAKIFKIKTPTYAQKELDEYVNNRLKESYRCIKRVNITEGLDLAREDMAYRISKLNEDTFILNGTGYFSILITKKCFDECFEPIKKDDIVL